MSSRRKVSRPRATKIGKVAQKVDSVGSSINQLAQHVMKDLAGMSQALQGLEQRIQSNYSLIWALADHVGLSEEQMKGHQDTVIARWKDRMIEKTKLGMKPGDSLCVKCLFTGSTESFEVVEREGDLALKCPRCSDLDTFTKENPDDILHS